MIEKTPDGKYRVASESKDAEGHHKNLGEFTDLEAAKHRLMQIEFFKHRSKNKGKKGTS